MLKRVIFVILLAIGYGTGAVAKCKPDFASQDKISKQPVVKWFHNLTAMGFWKSMIASDIDLLLIVGRYGDVNAINVEIVNKQNDRDRAAFDTRYRAAKGDRFVLGFKNAEPLTFVATEVNNQDKIRETEGLVMTVILSARLTDGQLADMRETLATRQIDAVRVVLSSGMIERAIDEEHGETMMRKLSCFYEYLDGRGIKLSPSPRSSATVASAETKGDQKLDPEVEDILAQDKLTIQAMMRRDMAYLDAHIADDAMFESNGRRLTKRMVIAQIMEQQAPPGAVRARHSDVSSTTNGQVVEVTATTTLALQTANGWTDFYEVRGTTKYKKVDGEWIMLGGKNEYEKRLQ